MLWLLLLIVLLGVKVRLRLLLFNIAQIYTLIINQNLSPRKALVLIKTHTKGLNLVGNSISGYSVLQRWILLLLLLLLRLLLLLNRRSSHNCRADVGECEWSL